MYLLGYDIGSSSIKAALVNADSGEVLASVYYPETEMDIISRQVGWAEQHPEVWWEHVIGVTRKLLDAYPVDSGDIQGIGLAYQMHGLVLVDKSHKVLRPAIIWCDSRAVEIGEVAYQGIGVDTCLSHLLNSPANFTASKLKWVKDHEPEIYDQIEYLLLPGDFIALKMTGEATTTISGLSEGILWDFTKNEVAQLVLQHFDFEASIIPEIRPTFSNQGQLSKEAAASLGLKAGIAIGYRAGDQPNNALSLNVLNPGEVAATGGTSGVVYGIVDSLQFDPKGRINGFAHVNHSKDETRIGQLLCINGAGIQYAWIKQQLASQGTSYTDMERLISSMPIGSDGLSILPFGNGAERILGNKNIGSHILNLQFNRHTRAHFYRAALEGIAFSFVYGINILKELGLNVDVIRVGNDNLFQSPVFSGTISNLIGCRIEMIETTGAVGAAKAAGYALGAYTNLQEALGKQHQIRVFEPENNISPYRHAYQAWESGLESILHS